MPSSKENQTRARITRTEAYAAKIQKMFSATVNEIIKLPLTSPDVAAGVMYSFDSETERLQKEVEQLLRRLSATVKLAIEKGVTLEWEEANKAADAIIKGQYTKKALRSKEMRGWDSRNGAAMRQFIARSDKGMNLSDRVWNTCRQLRDEMEVALTVSIGEGMDAGTISRRIRKCLNDPDLMFRRFRYKDEQGRWQTKWKKRIKDPDRPGKYRFIDYDKNSYKDDWTGKGYYKSSAQNAMRVARTETNIAYRRADNARWQGLDFVLGQRIQLSKSHPEEDICDTLAGDYPKDFLFDGWHPQCFCFVTPIMLPVEEMAKMNEAFARGEKYVPKAKPITEYPEGFKNWVSDNADKIAESRLRGTEPYFIRNNASVVDGILNPQVTPSQSAKSVKAIPTVEETLGKVTESGFYDDYGGTLEEGSRSGRTLQGYISELMGRNGKPQLASASDFEDLAKDKENIVIYRGFRESEAENIHNYKHGKVYDGRGGMGEGQYFATSKLKDFSETGEFIEAILDTRTAKIGDYASLEKQWMEERKSFRAKGRPTGVDRDDWNMQKEVYDDFGRWATLKGYDAYTTSDTRFKEYVVLNREALIVKDKGAPPKQKPLTITEKAKVDKNKRIAEARKKFDAYQYNESDKTKYRGFDENTGGYYVTLKGHQFSQVKPSTDIKPNPYLSGGQAELKLVENLHKLGKQIELLPENGKGQGKPDMLFDGKTWDSKYIPMANIGTIRTYIKDARKADCVIFHWEDKSRLNDLRTAMIAETKRFKSLGREHELPDIYWVDINGKLHLIWKKTKRG